MSNWVKATWDFDLPMADLVISYQQLASFRHAGESVLDALIASMQSADPEKIEAAVSEVIERYRPDLKGCILVAIVGDWATWKFAVIHSSLPKKANGDYPEKQPLIPDDRLPCDTTARLSEYVPSTRQTCGGLSPSNALASSQPARFLFPAS